MELNSLTAISPVDGRYRNKVDSLGEYFSEFALIRYRVRVEVEYFIALCHVGIPQLKSIDPKVVSGLRSIYQEFTTADAEEIKTIEKTTNHDVKAVEYFIKHKFDEKGLEQYKEFIHFGLTSQDINNTSVPLSIKECIHDVYMPALTALTDHLINLANEWKGVSMLAKTHGQPASPTNLGKEIMVFVSRLKMQTAELNRLEFPAKFGGATGNMNAHKVAYPEIKWPEFAKAFVNTQLGLMREPYTTQISNYDGLGEIFDAMKRINVILIDLCRDFWMYIMMEYFKQKIKEGEVGSSAMPHKVNPIDYENAEGNLGIANAIFEHLTQKLPVSRLQRDLTDSTVLRNIGVPIAHSLISIASIEKGLGKLLLNPDAIARDLENNWAVVAEALQTILRSEGYPNPYETLKALTRKNQKVTEQTISEFIDSLEVSDATKARMHAVRPENYTGYGMDME